MNSEKATDQKGLNVLDLLTVASLQKPEHQFRKALPSIKVIYCFSCTLLEIPQETVILTAGNTFLI